jgi:polysaccharide pyruvyl transferase
VTPTPHPPAAPEGVGVLTFHRCINHGSYWQARCLVEGLRARGHEAVILDHHSERVEQAETACALAPTLPTPVPEGDRPRYGAKLRRFRDAIARLPLSQAFDLHDPTTMAPLDTVVVGSDEVWNLRHPWYGGTGVFFGAGLPARRLVSYAASFGNYHAREGLEQHWADGLRAFAAIAVRDDNSRGIVAEAVGQEPSIVLDPCLQFPTPLEARWEGPEAPFAVVYGHNFSEPFARELRRWADERKLPLVSLSYRNDWADVQWLEAGPNDFAQAMARAAAVATNFFHGCVFALRNERPFACETSPYRGNKVQGLVATVGAERHLLPPEPVAEHVDSCLDQPLDPSIMRRIDLLRDRSARYLDAALG